MDVAKLWSVFRAYRAGVPLGDVVVLKLDAIHHAPKGIADKLGSLNRYGEIPDLATLRALPDGSLGREYARFLDANGIVPLTISADVRARFQDEPYALRYTVTHDLHHVLAGFDAGLAGELGLVAFNVGQGAAPISRAMLRAARAMYVLLSPTQAQTIVNNVRVGLAMGERADLVMAQPIEAWLAEPLAEVRKRLHIADPREAGVLPSGESVVASWLMRRTAG
jgi:ubiquinone biosynthesis protein Coq4